jgi:hypothetical protein
MVYFTTKNPNLGIFWMALGWKMLVDFTAVRYNLRQFGIIQGRIVGIVCRHLVYFFRFGMF